MPSYSYDPFGLITGESGTVVNLFRFTAREWDSESGLYYYRARYYDPKIGSFISEDPIGFDGGVNFYSYVDNDPVNYVDPFGQSKKKLFLYVMKRLKDGRVFAKKTNVPLSADEAKRLLRRNKNVFGSKKACKQVQGKNAIKDPAHPPGAGERRAHFHDADRRGGHAAFGPDEAASLTLASALAVNALRMSEYAKDNPNITENDVWIAGAWDVANTIDPLFITDAINWWFDLDD